MIKEKKDTSNCSNTNDQYPWGKTIKSRVVRGDGASGALDATMDDSSL
jgi:hypothetical protein